MRTTTANLVARPIDKRSNRGEALLCCCMIILGASLNK
jgi:hypothetical protein